MEYRTTKQNCICRFCNKEILRLTEKVIYHNTYGRRGTIIICKDCAIKIGNLATEE